MTESGLEAAPPPKNSLARDSAVRFTTDMLSFAAGGLVAVITARWLGASDKGVFSVLTLLSGLIVRLGTLGLGEATVVFVGQRRATRSLAVAASLCAMLPASIGAALILYGLGSLLLSSSSPDAVKATVLTAAIVPLAVFKDYLAHILLVETRVLRTSIGMAATSIGVLLGLVLTVVIIDGGLVGAVAATGIGMSIGALIVLQPSALRPPSLRAMPRSFLRAAIPYGMRVEAANLVGQGAARLDLVMVLLLLSSAETGVYSVALTIGILVATAPSSLAYAAFPRLARSSLEASFNNTAMLARVAMIAATIGAIIAAVLTPVLVSPVFGHEFSGAGAPAVILSFAGIPWAAQWVLARAAAASGTPTLSLRSFGLSLGVMLVADLALIPALDLVGAAIASALGTLAGLGLCVWWFRQRGLHPSALRPTAADVKLFLRVPGQLLARLRPAD